MHLSSASLLTTRAMQLLIVGSIKLYLRRDLNYEIDDNDEKAKPTDRKPTIVYAGLSADKKTTIWGKKVNE